MNKNLILSILVVILLGLGLWWFVSRTTQQGSPSPSPSASVTSSASSSPTATNTPASPNITITSPKANAAVDSPVTVTGRSRVFENQFTVQIKNSAGKVIATAHVFSDAKDSGQYGNYSVKIPIPAGAGSNFKIEALAYSAKGDGSFEGYASVAVSLKTTETSTVYAGFMQGLSNDCEAVTLYPRQIIKTSQVGYMSLYELLKGPGPQEVAQGASTQIPAGVTINSLRITGSSAYADFDQTLQQGVAGSCRVQAIRAQITATLKQFLGIDNVIISINGKTEGILQP